MLQALRLLQQASSSLVPAQIVQGLDKAKATIDELAQFILREETKNRSSFLRQVIELEGDMERLRNSVSGSTTVSAPAYNHFVSQSERLKEKIHTIYLSVQQMRTPDNEDEVDLLLDWTGELEGILVDQSTPKLKELRKVLPIPTPEQIEALSNRQLLLDTIGEFAAKFQSHTVTCFVSYDWESQPFVRLLVQHLKLAGIKVVLDIEYGPGMSRNLPKMEEEVFKADYLIVMGSAAYGKKSRDTTGSGVRDEVPLIQQRFSRKREDVLLVLLEQIPLTSFPPLLNTDRFVYADCRLPASYPSQMISMLERLFSHIMAAHPELAPFVAEKKRLFSTEATPTAPSFPANNTWDNLLLMTQYIFKKEKGAILTFYERLQLLFPKLSLDKKDLLLAKAIEPLRIFLPEKKLELEITFARWLARVGQKKGIDLEIFASYAKALQLAEELHSPELDTLYAEVSSLLSSHVFEKLSSLQSAMEEAIEKADQAALETLFQQFSLIRRTFCTSLSDREKLLPLYEKMAAFFRDHETPYAERLVQEQTVTHGDLPTPYIKRCSVALKSWKSTFASQELLTPFQEIVGWEKGTELLLAAPEFDS